ncbi:MAG: hypothetical protein M1829_005607 [Trizodia sp. TS-e1964]|nr:MAG: hypothetical protein M1829_005607 [Trizodia sp. TS-e1964]
MNTMRSRSPPHAFTKTPADTPILPSIDSISQARPGARGVDVSSHGALFASSSATMDQHSSPCSPIVGPSLSALVLLSPEYLSLESLVDQQRDCFNLERQVLQDTVKKLRARVTELEARLNDDDRADTRLYSSRGSPSKQHLSRRPKLSSNNSLGSPFRTDTPRESDGRSATSGDISPFDSRVAFGPPTAGRILAGQTSAPSGVADKPWEIPASRAGSIRAFPDRKAQSLPGQAGDRLLSFFEPPLASKLPTSKTIDGSVIDKNLDGVKLKLSALVSGIPSIPHISSPSPAVSPEARPDRDPLQEQTATLDLPGESFSPNLTKYAGHTPIAATFPGSPSSQGTPIQITRPRNMSEVPQMEAISPDADTTLTGHLILPNDPNDVSGQDILDEVQVRLEEMEKYQKSCLATSLEVIDEDDPLPLPHAGANDCTLKPGRGLRPRPSINFGRPLGQV